MKTRILLVVLCVILVLFSACMKIGEENSDLNEEYKTSLNELEKKIETLILAQNEGNRKEFEKLRSEIELLKKEDDETTNVTQNDSIDTLPKFLYEVNDGKATITGYTGKETYIVIPAVIDGYEVEAIGESSFNSSKITTVIISEGVKKIDWFAFYNCPHLTGITLPTSITSIGYAAFDGGSSSFTLYCHKNSYAYDYAISYGLAYVVV